MGEFSGNGCDDWYSKELTGKETVRKKQEGKGEKKLFHREWKGGRGRGGE